MRDTRREVYTGSFALKFFEEFLWFFAQGPLHVRILYDAQNAKCDIQKTCKMRSMYFSYLVLLHFVVGETACYMLNVSQLNRLGMLHCHLVVESIISFCKFYDIEMKFESVPWQFLIFYNKNGTLGSLGVVIITEKV